MAKIKNVQAEYLKRAHLASRKTGEHVRVERLPSSPKRARDFMTAPIDDSFYIDFGPDTAKKR